MKCSAYRDASECLDTSTPVRQAPPDLVTAKELCSPKWPRPLVRSLAGGQVSDSSAIGIRVDLFQSCPRSGSRPCSGGVYSSSRRYGRFELMRGRNETSSNEPIDPKRTSVSASGYIQRSRQSILDQTLKRRKGYVEANVCWTPPFRPFRSTSHYAKNRHSPESPLSWREGA